MIMVDNALKAREAEGRPIRVASIGAGFMGQGLTNQIINSVPGMRMVAAYNRRGQRALDMFAYAGRERRRRRHDARPGGGCHPRRKTGRYRRRLSAGALRRSMFWWMSRARSSSAPESFSTHSSTEKTSC